MMEQIGNDKQYTGIQCHNIINIHVISMMREPVMRDNLF